MISLTHPVLAKKLVLQLMEVRKLLTALVLLALMLFKVSAFHVYDHQDETENIEHCDDCEQALMLQSSDLESAIGIDLPVANKSWLFQSQDFEMEPLAIESSVLGSFCTRPPPYSV
ncbi:hypothetical protein ABV409_07925 [Flagellimonas sp. DF-77]|uniref:hypothetical protein n=1 Tax=Flagellimonas algarum TaxID=3230298 RepID=UPI0033934E42